MKPKIRFNGYKEEWNNICFENIFTMINDASSNVASKDYLTAGRYPIIDQGQDLIIGYTNKSTPLIPDNGYIIFGDHTRVIKYVDFPFFTGADGTKVLGIKEMQLYDSLFLYYLCSSLVIPNTGYNRHFKYLKNTTFHIPLISEQKRIASFFNFLDSLIAASTSRLASLKQIKAASLQAMFPQEGETMPRVRFKGFEGDWKIIKFADIAEIHRGLTYTPNNIVTNGVRVLRSSNINEDAFVTFNEDVFVTLNCINIRQAKEGDILITAANGSPRLVGKHAIIRNLGFTPAVAGGFMYLVVSNESKFLNASMNSSWYWRFLKIGVAGGNGSIGNLNRNNLEETEFLIPSLKEERDMIANYFTSLDSQISLQTQRLEKLKQIKSACLDNMFV